jgi:hypothetical protein
MRDPIKAIQNAASVCKKQLIVESGVGMEQPEEPVMGYLPRVPGCFIKAPYARRNAATTRR